MARREPKPVATEVRTSVIVTLDQLQELDRHADRRFDGNRSEAIREAIDQWNQRQRRKG